MRRRVVCPRNHPASPHARTLRVLRGIYYLFGLGRQQEHTDPHIVAGWRHPAELEPPLRADGTRDFRTLNGLLNQPHAALGRRGLCPAGVALLGAGAGHPAGANTSLHHMDFGAALTAMARVLRPGGRLASSASPRASPRRPLRRRAGVPAAPFYRAIYRKGESGALIADPGMSWREVRAGAARLLPGVRYRRHLLWRYSLLWQSRANRRPRRACRW